jgi:hypothetical protein
VPGKAGLSSASSAPSGSPSTTPRREAHKHLDLPGGQAGSCPEARGSRSPSAALGVPNHYPAPPRALGGLVAPLERTLLTSFSNFIELLGSGKFISEFWISSVEFFPASNIRFSCPLRVARHAGVTISSLLAKFLGDDVPRRSNGDEARPMRMLSMRASQKNRSKTLADTAACDLCHPDAPRPSSGAPPTKEPSSRIRKGDR